MAIMTQAASEKSQGYQAEDAMSGLFCKLNEGIDDMEQRRVQIFEKAWEEIDAI